jgi:hypothetical protein
MRAAIGNRYDQARRACHLGESQEDDDAQAPADRDDRFRDFVDAGIIEQRQQKEEARGRRSATNGALLGGSSQFGTRDRG